MDKKLILTLYYYLNNTVNIEKLYNAHLMQSFSSMSLSKQSKTCFYSNTAFYF